MKKLYAPQAASELKRSRFSFVKVLSLAIAATFLSNVTPSFSANVDLSKMFLEGVESAVVGAPQNVISAYDRDNSDLEASSASKENYITALSVATTPKVDVASDYANFLINTLSSNSDNNSTINALTTNALTTRQLIPVSQLQRGGDRGIELGEGANAPSVSSIAIGNKQDCEGKNCYYYAARALAERAIAIGLSAYVENYEGIGIGTNATVSADNGVGVGAFTQATAKNAIALGYAAKATGLSSISIGRSAHSLGQHSIAIGSEDTKDDYTTAKADYSTAVGSVSKALEYATTAIGHRAKSAAKNATALGFYSEATAEGSVALGSDSVSDRAASALGYTSLLQGPSQSAEAQWKSTRGAVSVGNFAKGITRQITGVAAGSESTDAVNLRQLKDLESVVRNEVADVRGSILLKKNDETKVITIGKDLWERFDLDFSGPKSDPRTISGVGAGMLSEESTEAVNGSQLFTTNQNVTTVATNIAKYLGGGAKYENGAWTAPKFTVKSVKDDGETENKEYPDVADALAGVGSSITNVQNKLTEQVNNVITKVESESFVQQDKTTHRLTIGAKVGGAEINIANESGADRIISGVGEAKNNNDAVNKSQLDSNIKNVNDNVTNKFSELTKNITNITQQVKGDALLWNDKANAFVARHEKSKEEKGKAVRTQENSRITFLAKGEITLNSTDAVNGGQLYTMGNTLATYFGGGAGYDEVGIWREPDFKIKQFSEDGTSFDKNYTNVADALAGVGSSLTNVQNKLTEQVNNVITKVESESFVQQDKTTSRLTIGAKVGGTEINIANESGADRIISGVGEAKNNNDAVNKGQLDKGLKDLSTSLQSDDSAVVHYDKTGDETDYTSVTLGKGKDKAAVGLHNVADGQIAKGSHDAITGGQINKIGEDVAKFLGGEASFKDGALTQPTYKLSYIAKDGVVTESDFQGVGTAFSGLDTNIKNVNARIKEVSEGVAQDSLLWSKEADAFVARHEKSKEEQGRAVRTQENSRITFLANGEISAKSTDAVTGSQLYSLNEQLATYFGGGAGYDKEGKWKAPDFKIKQFGEDGTSFDKNYTNVADALTGVGSSITNVQNKLTEQVNNVITKVESESFVQQDKTTHRLTIGAKVGGAEINIANESGADRIISGVGEAKNNNDAVNKSQLDSNIKNVNNNVTNKFNELTKNITNITQQVKGDALLWNDEANAFVARHEKSKEEKGRAVATQDNSKITFLLDGDVSKDSTDAVTGGQLYSLNEQLATYFGGGAGYDEQGQWKAPSFKVKTVKDDGKSEEIDYGNVADALAGVGNSVTNVKNEISKEITNVVSDSLVKQDRMGLITIGAERGGNKINILNRDGDARILSGVKAAQNGDEAVNKAQLDASLKDLSSSLQSEDSAVVLYDKKEGENGGIDYTSVTLGKGKDKAAVGLHNVADGQIAKDSRDAITGGQVNKIGEDLAKFLGGEASFKEGVFTVPTYKISNVSDDGTVTANSHNDVGSAFAGLDTSVKNVNTHLSNEVKKFDEKLSNITQAVQGDALLWGKTKGAFVATHGDNKENSKLTSLAAGSIVSGSSDAITGGQIYDLQKQFATYFGGGAGYNEKGEWVAPTFKLKTVNSDGSAGEEKVYNSVSEAFAGVASSITNVHNDVTNVVSDSLAKQDDNTKVITIGKEVEGTELNIANSKKEDRILSGVKAGVLSAESTEVVNGSQLFATNKNVTTVTTNLDSVSKNTSNYLGGGADVLVGNLPTYVVGGQSYHDVGSAFSGVDTSLTDLHNELSKNSNELTQTIEQNALLWSKEADAFVARHEKKQEEQGRAV
ncbi:hypothetical protein, partial [Bartonella sp. AA168HLJHH]|uniref:hypothetical protein n=1 Tax=Bartonella sp. AA168HLJHH TaxID=3243427 RepID=UPI0035CECA92